MAKDIVTTMKKTHKGLTLVEVIVSIAVFTIISLVMFSSFLAMRKVVYLQEEYVRIEMACHDINAYWDKHGNDWHKEYFGADAVNNGNKYTAYLKLEDNQFVGTTESTDYKVTYHYDNNKLIITSIYSISKSREYLNDPIDCDVSKGGS